MKFGFSIFPTQGGPQGLAAIARKADELGYESIFSADHLVYPTEMPRTYPYSADGTSPISPDAPRYDAWVLLAYLAAVTTRINLGTNVFILPLRDPIVTARAVTTLDNVSNGRLLMGVGVGWLEEEFQIVGRDFATRGPVADEMIDLLRALWTQRSVDFNGKYLTYSGFMFEPKPVSKPHPPILIGGTTGPALRRAARLGDGWASTGDDLETLKRRIARLHSMRKEHGRDTLPFSVTASAPEANADTVRRYQEAGVDRMLITPSTAGRQATAKEVIEGLERFAEEVMAKAA